MRYPASILALLDELERLPGIGPKSAQRIAYWLLASERANAHPFTKAQTVYIKGELLSSWFGEVNLGSKYTPKRVAGAYNFTGNLYNHGMDAMLNTLCSRGYR